MPDIFISWTSVDKAVVDRLKGRLSNSGLPFFISSDGMKPDDEAKEGVSREIRSCRLAIFLLSNEAVRRDWMNWELGYCESEAKCIAFVRVAELDQENMPPQYKNRQVTDLAEGNGDYEGRLSKFVSWVSEVVHGPKHLILPCALFAMTRAQYAELGRRDEAWSLICKLCEGAPADKTPLDDQFAGRYGDRVEDFAPFDGATMIDAVGRAIGRINQQRIRRSRPPIHLRWCHQELAGGSKQIRDIWRRGSSLLIVDSVSTCHPSVRDGLLALPRPQRTDRASLLWMPPYTRRTATLEDSLEAAAGTVLHIGDDFREFKEGTSPERWMAFDIGTRSSLSDWLHRVVWALPDEAGPAGDAVEQMHSAAPSGMRDAKFFG
jgi:hypothetical protein